MPYKAIFEQLQKQMGPDSSNHSIDELIASVSQLPCTGKGPRKPVFREQHVGIAVGLLDSGAELPAEFGCMHCTWLAALNWIKSAMEADRNGTPLPPVP